MLPRTSSRSFHPERTRPGRWLAGSNRQHARHASRGRIQIGKEGGDARRSSQQAADIARCDRRIAHTKRDVAVRVHPGERLRAAIEIERERHVPRYAVVITERHGIAERLAKGGVRAADVVTASGSWRVAQAAEWQIECIGRSDHVAFILDDGDLTDILSGPRRDAFRRCAQGCSGAVAPEDVAEHAARVTVDHPAAVLRTWWRDRTTGDGTCDTR